MVNIDEHLMLNYVLEVTAHTSNNAYWGRNFFSISDIITFGNANKSECKQINKVSIQITEFYSDEVVKVVITEKIYI